MMYNRYEISSILFYDYAIIFMENRIAKETNFKFRIESLFFFVSDDIQHEIYEL